MPLGSTEALPSSLFFYLSYAQGFEEGAGLAPRFTVGSRPHGSGMTMLDPNLG